MDITKKVFIAAFLLALTLLPSPAYAQSFDRNLYYGLQGDSGVTELQEFLTDQGLYSGPITGNFFSLTLKAVKQFQVREGITPAAGYFGPLTRARANALLSSQVQPSEQQAISETGSPTPTPTTPKTTTDVFSSLQQQISLLLQQVALLQQQLSTQQQTQQAIQQQQSTLQQIQQNTTPAPAPTPTPAPTLPPEKLLVTLAPIVHQESIQLTNEINPYATHWGTVKGFKNVPVFELDFSPFKNPTDIVIESPVRLTHPQLGEKKAGGNESFNPTTGLYTYLVDEGVVCGSCNDTKKILLSGLLLKFAGDTEIPFPTEAFSVTVKINGIGNQGDWICSARYTGGCTFPTLPVQNTITFKP